MAEKPEPSAVERNPDDAAPDEEDRDDVALQGIASLQRLRDRVETAAAEMNRLREENAALLKRVKKLETRPDVDPGGTFVSFDADSDQLKRKITSFIEAVDSYLERERSGS